MTDTERERINEICEVAGVTEIDDLSDGFHTFRQLYYQRMILFAAIVRQNKDKAWKSLRHEDGELCFGGGWFIVGIDTPEGSYTYHYENKYFDLFDCEILDYSKHWDGHTEKDVTRLLSLPVQPDHIADVSKKVERTDETAQNVSDSDLISRKAAIEALARMMPRSYTPDGSHPGDEEIFRAQEVFADCIEALEILPSAAPSTAHTTETTAETTAPSTDDWIPVERELPNDLEEVNVTWVNHEPEPYYESIKSKPFTASAVYYEGNWYWYSSVCADVLAEYGRNDVDKVDDTIEITAWRPLPEPYRGGDSE